MTVRRVERSAQACPACGNSFTCVTTFTNMTITVIYRAVCADFETELVEFNGEMDHVHLLVHYPPKVALSRLVGSLKGVSARRLRQEFPGHIRKYLWSDHFWSPFYFAASCGGAPLSIIKEYIENQKRPG